MSTVLVADDDPIIAELLRHKLTRGGHDVHVVADGVRAMEAMSSLRPDIVIADWMMPNMDGLELCRSIRASALPDIPIVLLTAKSEPIDAQTGLAAGATAYVTKPFSPRLLMRQVDALLAGA